MTLGRTTLCLYAKCHFDEFRILLIIMLDVIMVSVVMLNVTMVSVLMLNVIMVSVVMLNVIMVNVIMVNVIMVSVVALDSNRGLWSKLNSEQNSTINLQVYFQKSLKLLKKIIFWRIKINLQNQISI